jgi:small subunit ribosomal protein S20
MPSHKSAEERVRRNRRDADQNLHYKRLMKESIKSVLSAKNKAEAQESYRKLVTLLDKMVVKGIIHKNKSANRKSVLSKKVNAMP